MNVRERAKTFEALMSYSTGSPESERKRSQEGTEHSGSVSSNGQNESDQEKHKPVPPPRKKERKKVPTRPETSKVQQKITPAKSSPEVQRKQPPERPKVAPKKPPPPRPAPYKQLSSPSLTSHIPHAKRKELSASLSRRREASEPKESPEPTEGTPKATSRSYSKEHPVKPPRGSPRSSPKSSPRVSRGSPQKTSSCEIELSQKLPKRSSDDSPEKAQKGNPKRPPPPKRTSSLSRKSKPPVPPKPKRPPRPVEQEKKAATIPRTGSVESKEAVSKSCSLEDNAMEDVVTKQRSLSSPITNGGNNELEDREKQSDITENGVVESHIADKDSSNEGQMALEQDDKMISDDIEESKSNSDSDNAQKVSKVSEEVSPEDEPNSREIQNNINEKENIETISAEDETPSADLIIENVERTSVDNTEFKSVSNSEDPLPVDNISKVESSLHELVETSGSKEINDAQTINNIAQEDLELHSSSVGFTEDVPESANLQSSLDTEIKETVMEVSNEGTDDTLSISEPIETDIDAEIINSSTQSDYDETFESSHKEVYPCEDDSFQKEGISSVGPTTTAENTCEEQDNSEAGRQESKEGTSEQVECVAQGDSHENLFQKENDGTETLAEDASGMEGETVLPNEIYNENSNHVEQDLEETNIDVVECLPNESELLTTIQTKNKEEEEKEECISDVEKSFLNEQNLPEKQEPTEGKTEEGSTNVDENDVKDVIALDDESDIAPGPRSPPSDDKRSSYMETSLDDEFFNGDEVNESEMTESDLRQTRNEQPAEEVSEEPYETDIDLYVAMDEGLDSSVSSSQDHPTDEICISEQTKSKGLSDGSTEVQEEEPASSPARMSQYENVMITSPENEQGKDDEPPLSPQPVKPSRPSRLKNRHTYENTSLVQTEESAEEYNEEAESEKKSSQRTDVYENMSIIQPQDISVGADENEAGIENTSNKRTDVYENAVVIRQSVSNEEKAKEVIETSESAPKDECPKENKQQPPQKATYENVVFRGEETFEEDDNVYQVPRRNSFHSDSPTSSLVRSARSASVGSMERKKGGRNARFQAESTYATPPTRKSTLPEAEETYASPKSVRAYSTEETYVAPRSVRTEPDADNVYVAPRSIQTPSTEQENLYVTPKSVATVDSEDLYVTPKSVRAMSEETPISESEYHVPSSLSSEEVSNDVYQVPKNATEPENEVYSVPASVEPSKDDEPSLDENPRLRRATRSSVLTSREQLPSSLKNAPPKPPRSSFDGSEQQSETPKPRGSSTLGDSQQTPEASPRPKPRSSVDNSSEEKTAKDENEDQSNASPKPKRPAPPRPKAPSFVGTVNKSTTTNDAETKQIAPPRPPPPPLNRVSVVSSEQDSLPSSPMDSSSESEDEQPPAHAGPPKKKTYHIAHEILSTEKTFVTALTLCYEDCYGMIKEADVVPESTLNDIFKDLGNIYHLDDKFLNELQERMKTWEENERIGDIVKKYSYFLKMYTTYINHYDKAVSVLQETIKENLQFAELVQKFQASKKCKGLFLESFMLKPVQRIPSYRLLLIDYLKHLPPDSDEYKDIKVALDIVSEVATHINESMKKSDNFQRVLGIQESLVGNAEIVKPGREFIKEGTLQKLCRKDMQERTFFLLTDVLLYTSAVGGGQYKLKGTFPLLGIKVALPDSPEFENEFSIISKSRSFTLSASTQAERDEWIEELENAISALTKKKSTFLLSKDGTVSPPEGGEEESKLGDKAPVWIQDTRVTMCMLCTDKFTVTNRRHHCRGCGKVVCGSCSDNLAPLAYLDYSQARVCEVCYEVLLKEQNKSIKEATVDTDPPPHSPVGIGGDDLDRINRKPPKFEILHRFKPGSKRHNRRSKIIMSRPSVRTEVVGHDSESQMSGYLRFKRTNKHGWKRLWFVLKDNVLYTYKASEDVVAMETIPILGYMVQEATRTEADEIQFQLKHAGLPPLSFKTETESSAFRWIQELRKATTL